VITAEDWREVAPKNTLLGFCSLWLQPSGLLIRECSLHERSGRRWVALPGRPQLDSEGRHRKDPATGKALWLPVVEIKGKAERERFQTTVLAAVDKLRGKL
jgi:hypothetical protein